MSMPPAGQQRRAPVVLLLCTTTRACPEAEAVAIERARRASARLHAAFILDPELLSATASRMARAGFGGTEGEGLAEAYRERARERLAAIEAKALEQGLEVRVEVREGSLPAQSAALVEALDPLRVVCARKQRSHYARGIFERGLLDTVRERVVLEEVSEP
jgi:hypothetical protein